MVCGDSLSQEPQCEPGSIVMRINMRRIAAGILSECTEMCLDASLNSPEGSIRGMISGSMGESSVS